MMPKIRVSPAAIRNSMIPNWVPFSTCSTRWNISARRSRPTPRGKRRRLFHLAFTGIGIGVVGKHDFLDLADKGAFAVLADPQQVEVFDREMVGVVLERPAHRREIGLLEGGDHAVLV